MNRFKGLNEKEMCLVRKAGYTIEENKEYSKEDYEKCASVISDYIMSHSKMKFQELKWNLAVY